MVKNVKKVSPSTKLKKILNNPKYVILLVFLIGFAGIGGYKVYQSSAATQKTSANVTWCNYLIQSKKITSMRIGSEGVCVTTLGRALNGIRTLYQKNNIWDNINYSAIGKSDAYDTTYFNAVKGFQTWQQTQNVGPIDGIAGPKTWARVTQMCHENYNLTLQCGLDK